MFESSKGGWVGCMFFEQLLMELAFVLFKVFVEEVDVVEVAEHEGCVRGDEARLLTALVHIFFKKHLLYLK